jgi:hypothetical protein
MISKKTTSSMHIGIDDVVRDHGSIGVSARNESDAGLAISLDNYSTKTSAEGFDDAIIFLELNDGKPILRVWAAINSEEPTHIIDLSGAHVNCRLTTFKGNLYYIDHDGIKCHICDFEEQAANATLLERKVLDQLWDNRLDAASCSPHFEYEVVG